MIIISYLTTVFLDNKILSLAEGKSKSESKNTAALMTLKYLLSLDESCFENANFIVNRTKKNSNSKQRTSTSKELQGNSDQKGQFQMEEVKIENIGNFAKKRKNSIEDKLENEGDNLIRKKLQFNCCFFFLFVFY